MRGVEVPAVISSERAGLRLESLAVEAADPVVEPGVVEDPLHVLLVAVDGQLEQVRALAKTGKPNLPVKGTLIGLPEGSSPTLTVIETDMQVLKDLNLQPTPQPVMVDEDTPQARLTYRFTKDAEVYSRNAFLPDRVAKLGPVAYMRNQQVAQLRIFPVRYNPVTMEAQYHSRIVLRIDYGSTVLETGARSKRSPKTLGPADSGRDNPFDVVLKNLLLNYDEVR